MASREVQSILDYIKATGVPHRVTAILGTWKSATNPCAPHAAGSLHCAEGTGGKGLAVDFGGAQPGTSLEALRQMGEIHAALMKVAPQLAELIHNGPGITKAVKNGKVVDGLHVYGPTTWAAHRNHLHVAVTKGTFLDSRPAAPPVLLEVRPMWDPPLQVVDFLPYWSGSGGYMLFADGGIGAVGDAPYREGKQPLGNDYWLNRKPARLQRLGDGYVVIATSGERYEYP